MQTDDLNIGSTRGGVQTEERCYVLTLRQMYILAAVSQLNCLMASGIRRMKVTTCGSAGTSEGFGVLLVAVTPIGFPP